MDKLSAGAPYAQCEFLGERADHGLGCVPTETYSSGKMGEWQRLADKLKVAGVRFIIEPHVRFKGEVGEQATMFLLDPCGNALEFKAFKDIGRLFAK